MDLKSILTKGTVPLIVLEILRNGDAYGYQIVQEITKRSDGKLQYGQGTVYPLLYKLEEQGYVESVRKPAPSGKERRYYSLTAEGLKYLEASKSVWAETNHAIGQALGLNPLALES